uniref:Putative ovule protein n=1 Tax=Solanum chacoense TaxID=4108 RepID=A0A0V0HX26_SOLCH
MVIHFNMVLEQAEVQDQISPHPYQKEVPRAWPLKKEFGPHVRGRVENIIKQYKCSLSNSLSF